MINEAIFALMEGVGTAEAIDTVMKLGMNHPMGPLTLADFIGLDVCLAILEVLHDGLGDPKYRPCPLLRRMVAAGQLGRKSGPGVLQVLSAGTSSNAHGCTYPPLEQDRARQSALAMWTHDRRSGAPSRCRSFSSISSSLTALTRTVRRRARAVRWRVVRRQPLVIVAVAQAASPRQGVRLDRLSRLRSRSRRRRATRAQTSAAR